MLHEKINIPKLGSGIYTVPDVSIILHLPSYRVRRWLNEFWNKRFGDIQAVKYSWGEGRSKTVNFLTLIEFYTFFQLKQFGVTTFKIIKSHQKLSLLLDSPFPFAHTAIYTDSKSILFSPAMGSILDTEPDFQYNFYEIIEPFCNKIDYGSDFHATRLWPIGKEKSIIVDPSHQFGQPVIEGTNILAQTIYDMFKGGESIQFISSLYELSNKNVEDSILFFNTAA